MTTFHKTLFLAGLLVCVLGLPQVSFAVTGCSDAMLTGYYNVQVTNANFMNVLAAVNTAAGQTTGSTGATTGGGTSGSPGFFGGPTGFGTGTGATGATTGGSTGSTGATTGAANSSGFNPGIVGTPASLAGSMPGLGRFFLDGHGHIIGQHPGITAGASMNIVVGTYTVNTNCTASINLATGQTFDAVVGSSGAHLIFLETDTAGGGVGGTMDRSQQACVATSSPRSFGFSLFGALPPTTATQPAFMADSTIGQLDLSGDGGFSITGWAWTNGALHPIMSTGTYTVNQDCSLNLTFAPSGSAMGGATGGVNYTPSSFQGLLLNGSSGAVVVHTTGNTLTGEFVAQ